VLYNVQTGGEMSGWHLNDGIWPGWENDGMGFVRVAKRRDGICPVAKMTAGDLPEMAFVRTPLMR